MVRNGWRRWVALGALGVAGLLVGCDEKQRQDASQDSREAGRQVGQEARRAAEEVREGAEKAARELREGAEGFREGYGGSGSDKPDTREREQR